MVSWLPTICVQVGKANPELKNASSRVNSVKGYGPISG